MQQNENNDEDKDTVVACVEGIAAVALILGGGYLFAKSLVSNHDHLLVSNDGLFSLSWLAFLGGCGCLFDVTRRGIERSISALATGLFRSIMNKFFEFCRIDDAMRKRRGITADPSQQWSGRMGKMLGYSIFVILPGIGFRISTAYGLGKFNGQKVVVNKHWNEVSLDLLALALPFFILFVAHFIAGLLERPRVVKTRYANAWEGRSSEALHLCSLLCEVFLEYSSSVTIDGVTDIHTPESERLMERINELAVPTKSTNWPCRQSRGNRRLTRR